VRVFARVLATWFGCGYVPKGPGTAGTLGGLLVAWILHRWLELPPLFFGALALVFLFPAIWASGAVAREDKTEDPQIVVIDEVIGLWITLAGAKHFDWASWLLAFVLFRLFDIWKPWPVRQFENLPGGVGIVLDDVMAGVYGALVMFAAGWFNLY
jgi:phosphatidylglycerophosphatase A